MLTNIPLIQVTPSTLLKKKVFNGLTEDEKHSKALDLGWRFNYMNGKYYRSYGY